MSFDPVKGGKFLAQKRKEMGLTQEGLAAAAGMTDGYKYVLPFQLVTRIERGVFSSPKFEDILTYARVVHCDPTEVAIAYGAWPEDGIEKNQKLRTALVAAQELSEEMQDYIVRQVLDTVDAVRETAQT